MNPREQFYLALSHQRSKPIHGLRLQKRRPGSTYPVRFTQLGTLQAFEWPEWIRDAGFRIYARRKC